MPKSKNRRKNGKKVKHSTQKREQRLQDMPVGVSLQDLINVLAYQEYVKDGTIVDPNVKVDIPEEIPVTIGEGENKRQVGTATRIPGDEDNMSVRLDPEHQHLLVDDNQNFSVDFDDPDTRAVIRAVNNQDEEIEDGR